MITALEPIPPPVAQAAAASDATPAMVRAMQAARSAQARWACAPLARRLELVRQLRRLLAENAAQLAEASAGSRQRPALESLTAEVIPLGEACRFLERNAKKILSAKRFSQWGRPLWLSGVRAEIRREPLGVVLIIGPGNYPLLLPGVQLVQALVAGNAVLLKPGVPGTAAACALCDLVVRAGFDPQLVTLLAESAAAARSAIAAHPDKVVFTGSAATGEKILDQLAPRLIPATMELSGSDAVIVRRDADLDLTVKALVFALALNGGATCMAPKRAFVHASIAAELERRLALSFHARANQPSASRRPASAKHLPALIADAIDRGAFLIAGDEQANGVVILGGVAPSSQLLREDIFVPVLAIVAVAEDDEAVRRANDSRFALAASIFSRDEACAHALAARVNAGVVTINDIIAPSADARLPFGGRSRSGFGVTRGAEGLLELTTTKVVTRSHGRFRPAFNPPHPGDAALLHAYIRLTHGRGLKSRWAALVSIVHGLLNSRKTYPKDMA